MLGPRVLLAQCQALFDATIQDIQKQIKIGKTRVIELCSIEKEQLADAERERDMLALEARKKEQLSRARLR